MPYRKEIFEKNQPYHIISRAVEERKIFEKEEDCFRFIFQIYAANVGKPAFKLWQKDVIWAARRLLKGKEVSAKFVVQEHPPLVHILDFSLVVNHYHLYLVSNIENGVPIFMKKLNGGFAKYFNLKYGRKGSLFGSRYTSVSVKTVLQSDAVSRYVSIINPLDVYQPGWRREGLKNKEEAFNFLMHYQFSSFPDNMKMRRSKIIAPQQISERYRGLANFNEEDHLQFVQDFLEQRLSPSCQPLFLE